MDALFRSHRGGLVAGIQSAFFAYAIAAPAASLVVLFAVRDPRRMQSSGESYQDLVEAAGATGAHKGEAD